ncbi:MAG: response regulator [Pseudomonadales bacterium]|nr:response regulator [Pseudomonadales bacterium]
MVNEGVQDFHAKMAALAAEFAQHLVNDIQQLRKLVENADEPGIPDILARVHKLAGSSLTFGYQALGDQLRRIEQDLQEGELHWPSLQQRILALQVPETPVSSHLPKSLEEASDQRKEISREAKRSLIYFLATDNQDFSKLLMQLQGYNYEVMSCLKVDELYKKCRDHQPDAIVLSVAMNDKQGHVMQQQVQELRGICSSPILLCSPYQEFSIKLMALRAGVQGFFDRSISVISLDARLEHLLDQHSDPWRVLLVDDDESILEYYLQVLQAAGLNVRVESDPERVLSTMQQFQPDVLVFDLNMPACRGDELAAIIRLDDTWLHVPIIYLSSEINLERQLAAQTLAGDEFLTKPIDLSMLTGIIRVRAKRSRQLSQMLIRDGLTGLLTHTEIKERLSQELVRVSRNGGQCCVAMLDIDWFKKVVTAHPPYG